MQSKDLIKTALSYYGKKAIAGDQDEKAIINMYKEAGHPEIVHDEVAWCSAFVNSICFECGYPQTYSLLAKSWLTLGVPVDTPQLGDIVIFWRDSMQSGLGHVGFFIADDGDGLFVLGGNQNNSVNIARFPKQRLLAYRRLSISV